ncbi:MAG: glucose-6-phosphate isomerase family protein [bacterium]|nr:glucose-6-phosphate isomerase family protein [bacterium]
MKPYAERTHEEMRDVLMSPLADGPQAHYYMVRGGDKKSNITVWEAGTVGAEYIKSYGHYHTGDLEETYTILQGEGIIILQGQIEDEGVTDFKAIKVKAGDKIHIPKNTGHLAINIGTTWLVTSDDSPASLAAHADYSLFKKMRGAAYYVVEKDGKPSFVKNPLYGNVPDVRIE